MIDSNNIKLINLYTDESGGSALTENRYRFFVISSVLLSPSEKELCDLLLSKWREKYLMNPHRCFHAAEFFENYTKLYKRPELKLTKIFNQSIRELIGILKFIDFKANIYYVDLFALRKKLTLQEPPAYKNSFANTGEKKQYRIDMKNFEELVVNTVGIANKHLPLTLTLKKSFIFHNQEINTLKAKDKMNREVKGYVNFESLSGADPILITNFHTLKRLVDPLYEEKIIGINLSTKNSLDAGIELADLIAYTAFQTLRFSHKRIKEYSNLSQNSINLIREMRAEMNDKYKIKHIDVTNDSIK